MASSNSTWTIGHTVVVIGTVVLGTIIVAASDEDQRVGPWIAVMVLVAILVIATGHGITGRLGGWLIDDRNMMSLSRLQIGLWTVLIVSAYLTSAGKNLQAGETNPLEIAIPEEIWVVLGITGAALFASPLVRSNKQKRAPNVEETEGTFKTLAGPDGVAAAQNTIDSAQAAQDEFDSNPNLDPANPPPPVPTPVEALGQQTCLITAGQVVKNADPECANLGDIFRGEEVGNANTVDLGKVQMFLFTVILLVVYGVGLGNLLDGMEAITAFPEVSDGMVALLLISNVTYVAYKATPHSEDE